MTDYKGILWDVIFSNRVLTREETEDLLEKIIELEEFGENKADLIFEIERLEDDIRNLEYKNSELVSENDELESENDELTARITKLESGSEESDV